MLHDIVRDIWLKRHDVALQAEQSARRKGRPKSARQMMLEEIILREAEDYRTGLGVICSLTTHSLINKISIHPTEVPDITHPLNVALFRRWGQTGVGYIDLLRFIRIKSEDPTSVVVSRPGKHQSLLQLRDVDMQDDATEPLHGEGNVLGSLDRFASTMQTMDDGPAATAAD
jgi:translation machinery-associated protein 16